MESLKRRFKHQHGMHIKPVGYARGLALWWNDEVELMVNHGHKNIITMNCNWFDGRGQWFATFVYGTLERKQRKDFFFELSNLPRMTQMLPLYIGDFNAYIAASEKKSKKGVDVLNMKLIQLYIDDLGLLDIEFKGELFT